MAISVFDLFKIGIGPSSSHTVGPMRAAGRFVETLQTQGLLTRVHALEIHLYGSLGATGKGHGSDKAILLGLQGEQADSIDTTTIDQRLLEIRTDKKLKLLGQYTIPFVESEQLILHERKSLPYHPNGMQFFAYDENGSELLSNIYYSVGGGFVVEQADAENDHLHASDETEHPYPFHSMAELLQHCVDNDMSISQIMLENEKVWRSEAEINSRLLTIWQVMQDCIRRGCETPGILPGGLNVKRRAHGM